MRRTTRSEDAASAVEYGLLVAGIAALIAATVFVFGDMVLDMFDTTCDAVDTAGQAHSMTVVSCV